MAFNKITYKGNVLIDLTDSTVTPEHLPEGIIAYGADGERIVGIGDSSDNSIVGTWVFKDELTLPSEQTEYSVDFTTDGNPCVSIYIQPAGTHYIELGYILANEDDYLVYYSDSGWDGEEYKTIEILAEPTDEEFITWLKANATKTSGGNSGGNNPTAYHLTSVDELPTDAVDGSLAVVESDSLVGEWMFNNQITILEATWDVVFFTKENTPFNRIRGTDEGEMYYDVVYDDYDHFSTPAYAQNDDGDAMEWYTDGGIFFPKEITISKYTQNADFIAWLPQNATRISGGHTLYSRENGEWVSKGEI